MDMLSEVNTLSGIGEKTTELLKKAGIYTIRDLFYYLPRGYENYQNDVKIADLHPGKVVIKGQITSINTKHAKTRRLTITEAIISDQSGSIRAVWFNQPYREKQLETGKTYLFSGRFELTHGRYQLTSPSCKLTKETETRQDQPDTTKVQNSPDSAAFQPIYSQKTAIKPDQFKKLIAKSKSLFAKIPDLLPDIPEKPAFVKHKARSEALYNVHFPDNDKEAEDGKEYLAYEEIFELLLASQLNREENQKLKAKPLPYIDQETKKLLKTLPFTLTDGQKRATWDILQDLGKTTPMNRLLQGDVGSGKTVVSAIAAYQAIKNGSQVALLAPTSILAKQHAEGLQSLLGPLDVKIGLLIGATKPKQKEILKKALKNGEIDLLIGTHAIITDDTEFKNLNLCIIDEQHRFGVEQRQKLLLKSPKNEAPHLLSMTATPIPRSLQLTIFGDLSISTIPELPKGRQPIETKILKEIDQKETLYPKVKEEIKKGRQVYWICKSIEDNPRTETTSVKKEADRIKKIFLDAKIEYLHGRMKTDEKEQIMEKFQAGKIDILVSTTVVEVGVNVPNATLMVIMDAENYGLAQLHQLRGRVGRGKHQSYCFLVKTGEDAPSRRLRELEKSTDGFHLAEVDLKIRGPGEIYGTFQHGALDLKIASLSDTHLISAARKHIKAFLKIPPEERFKNYPELRDGIKHYQQIITLN